jgi:GMP synthase (glutamine-hydrolysing)
VTPLGSGVPVCTGYALQFHPEVTHAMMYRWLVRGAHRRNCPVQSTRREHTPIAQRTIFITARWPAAFIDH